MALSGVWEAGSIVHERTVCPGTDACLALNRGVLLCVFLWRGDEFAKFGFGLGSA